MMPLSTDPEVLAFNEPKITSKLVLHHLLSHPLNFHWQIARWRRGYKVTTYATFRALAFIDQDPAYMS
jgi:hypothetical protein